MKPHLKLFETRSPQYIKYSKYGHKKPSTPGLHPAYQKKPTFSHDSRSPPLHPHHNPLSCSTQTLPTNTNTHLSSFPLPQTNSNSTPGQPKPPTHPRPRRRTNPPSPLPSPRPTTPTAARPKHGHRRPQLAPTARRLRLLRQTPRAAPRPDQRFVRKKLFQRYRQYRCRA